jgi:ABC-type transport system involved in multi-copper enzyme maturation permease subunit
MIAFRHAAAAAATLAGLQIFGRQRRWLTLGVFSLPVLVAGITRYLSEDLSSARTAAYIASVAGVYASAFVPFIGVFWGSAVFSDEVEGKTLVFLWTRPTGRTPVLLIKWLLVVLAFVLLLVPSLALMFGILFYDNGFGRIVSDGPMLLYDLGALTLGGLTYSAFGLLLATLFKRPLAAALFYVLIWDNAMHFLPGYLKLFSIRHYVAVLSSRPSEGAPKGWLEFLAKSDTTETQAAVTLVAVALVLLAMSAIVLTRREYRTDDPARSQ